MVRILSRSHDAEKATVPNLWASRNRREMESMGRAQLASPVEEMSSLRSLQRARLQC